VEYWGSTSRSKWLSGVAVGLAITIACCYANSGGRVGTSPASSQAAAHRAVAAPLAEHRRESAPPTPRPPPGLAGGASIPQAPRKAGYSKLISHTAGTGRVVALTFDDGPNPTWTPRILDVLGQHGVHATFCLVGRQVRQYPELVRRVVAEGHRLCDHTFSHDERLFLRSPEQVRAEIMGGLAAIREAVPDASVSYFRAPGGTWSETEVDLAAQAGMQPLSWSADSLDWRCPGVSTILANIRRKLGDRAVILLHDGGGDRSQSVAALRILLGDLARAGYGFDFPA
jgi:peptidoglycan-N-acetylglucosamine deacetylase